MTHQTIDNQPLYEDNKPPDTLTVSLRHCSHGRMFSSSKSLIVSLFIVEVSLEEHLLLSQGARTTTENLGTHCVFVAVHAAIVVSPRFQFPVRLCPDSQHQADVPAGTGRCHRLSVTPAESQFYPCTPPLSYYRCTQLQMQLLESSKFNLVSPLMLR